MGKNDSAFFSEASHIIKTGSGGLEKILEEDPVVKNMNIVTGERDMVFIHPHHLGMVSGQILQTIAFNFQGMINVQKIKIKHFNQ